LVVLEGFRRGTMAWSDRSKVEKGVRQQSWSQCMLKIDFQATLVLQVIVGVKYCEKNGEGLKPYRVKILHIILKECPLE
jgi:hypothetical protein